jgi:xanthine dehydrogenase small subunit
LILTRASIRFLRRTARVELHNIPPTKTLLDYLRLDEKSRGTKEGCAEGDCGACTVAVGSLKDGKLVYEPVNACITFLGQADGKQIVTVDDLAPAEGRLHPIQQAMVDSHASQCGFCTPGFVMALFPLFQKANKANRQQVVDQLAGNLCRCTGYRPIVDAALASIDGRQSDAWSKQRVKTEAMLRDIADGEDVFLGDDERFFAAPATDEGLAALMDAHPEATIVSGATDVGLWVTKQLRDLPKIVFLGRMKSLKRIVETKDAVTLGAAVTYAEAEKKLSAIDPDLGEVLRRLGSKQVRATGTVGGNIANGSPIGDSPPVLIALGSSIELRESGKTRTLDLENFFIAYGKQDRAAGEVLWSVTVPKLKRGEAFRCYKITKRFDQDISSVLGAFKFKLDGRRIVSARIAYGGMAATPKRAAKTEQALSRVSLDDRASWRAAEKRIAEDFAPIDDHRASAAYRIETATALLTKALTEIAGALTRNTRITGHREDYVDAR